MNSEQKKFLKDISSKWKIAFYLFSKLPSAIFWGISVKSASSTKCEVIIPYGWRTRNPFKSMYFAAQAGAAELSTGILVQVSLQGKERWSMYVTGFSAEYGVRATTNVLFTCDVNGELDELIKEIELTGKSQEITLESIGVNNNGEVVSKFYIKWSLKKK